MLCVRFKVRLGFGTSSCETFLFCRTILLTIPGVFLLVLLAAFTGLTVVAYYSQIQCDPLANKEIHNENQVNSKLYNYLNI